MADRWHLLHNLGKVVERAVARLGAEWIPPALAPPTGEAAVPPRPEGPLAQRHRERHVAVHELMNIGVRADKIAEQLRLSGDTVRKFMRAATADELIVDLPSRRASSLDDHADYLARRWAEGCTSTSHLHRELRERGLAVSERTVRRFLVHMRANAAPAVDRPVAPKNREVTALALSHPDTLTDDERVTLKQLRDRCPDLDAACDLVSAFAEMLIHLYWSKTRPWGLTCYFGAVRISSRGRVAGLQGVGDCGVVAGAAGQVAGVEGCGDTGAAS